MDAKIGKYPVSGHLKFTWLVHEVNLQCRQWLQWFHMWLKWKNLTY